LSDNKGTHLKREKEKGEKRKGGKRKKKRENWNKDTT